MLLIVSLTSIDMNDIIRTISAEIMIISFRFARTPTVGRGKCFKNVTVTNRTHAPNSFDARAYHSGILAFCNTTYYEIYRVFSTLQ